MAGSRRRFAEEAVDPAEEIRQGSLMMIIWEKRPAHTRRRVHRHRRPVTDVSFITLHLWRES